MSDTMRFMIAEAGEEVARIDASGRLVHAYGIPAEVLAAIADDLRESGLDPATARMADPDAEFVDGEEWLILAIGATKLEASQ